MASTYSTSLKLELIGSGDQSGTWGTTTNTNLGTLLEQAIVGQTTITMANADYTLSDYNGASDEARNAVIIITGSQNATYNVICPAQQKLYMITNSLSASATAYFKPVGGTALTILNGRTVFAYCTGTAMVELSGSLTATTATNIAGGVASQIPYQSAAGTTSFIANGTSGQILKSNGTSVPTWVDQSTLAVGSATTATTATSATNATNVTGNVAVANGGTGRSTLTANAVLTGNGTSGINSVSPGTSGNLLVSNGTSWTSTTLASSGVKLGLGITGEVWSDASGTYSINSSYTNNYGYPIAMTVGWSNGNGYFTVNGVDNSSSSGANGNTNTGVFIIIPSGATWQFNYSGGGVQRWTMLT